MGDHNTKTTIEIADGLFKRVRCLARRDKTSFRALAEAGLRLVVSGKRRPQHGNLPRLVTYGASTGEFKDWIWDRIRDEIYRSRGT